MEFILLNLIHGWNFGMGTMGCLYVFVCIHICVYFPGGSDSKASAYSAGDLGSTPGSGRSPGEGNGNPLQYSCLENPMGGGAWWAIVHGVAESDTTERLHSLTIYVCIYIYISLSRVRLFVTLWTIAHQAPPPMGFSRQEHWSGLPFSSPMHESEKWKWSRLVVSNS